MLNELCINRIYLHVIKAMYEKPWANIVLKNEFLKFFSLISGTIIGFPLSVLPLNIVLEVLTRAIKQETQIKNIQIRKN